MKKFLLISLGLSFFVLFALSLDWQRSSKEKSCPFCAGPILDRQLILAGDQALALLTHKPAVDGHVLIIPKRHVERFEDLTAEEIKAIQEMVKQIAPMIERTYGYRDYLLLQKNGRKAGQSVSHLHFHYLPAAPFLTFRFFLSPWLKPLDEQELKERRDFFSHLNLLEGSPPLKALL